MEEIEEQSEGERESDTELKKGEKYKKEIWKKRALKAAAEKNREILKKANFQKPLTALFNKGEQW